MESLGARLKRLRGDVSQTALAKRTGVSQGRIREIEEGMTAAPRVDTLRKLADGLGIAFDELASGAPAGMLSEAEAQPFDAAPVKGLLFQLAPNARHPVPYRVARDLPGFGLMAGDMLVVELQGTPAQGSLVVATLADPDTGAAETVIRRYLPPVLVSADAAQVHPLDGGSVAVLGQVLASWRSAIR